MTSKKTEKMDALLFIDANIFLDFYRARDSDISIKFLKQIEACKDSLIISSQLDMEYKKNRQKVIVDSLKKYGKPDWSKITPPVIVSDFQPVKMINDRKNEIIMQQKKVNEKINKILKSPSYNDPVYQSLQRVFKHKSPYNLNRENKERFTIRRLARKRFFLGYPPRKEGDTSYGDAIHWEWVIRCSIKSGKDIVIVTRDKDFGITHLNDWLAQEFKQRVGYRRKIKLTDSLSAGLKIIHANITKEMEKEERKTMAEMFEEDSRIMENMFDKERKMMDKIFEKERRITDGMYKNLPSWLRSSST